MIICDKCKGKGYTVHPFWEIFHKYYKNENPLDIFKSFYGFKPDKLPSEKEQCSICKGKGYFESKEEKIFYEISNGKECIIFYEFKNFLKNIKKYKENTT